MTTLDKRQQTLNQNFPADSPLSDAHFVERVIEWTTFFRRNISAFIECYLGIPLYLYQVIFLHAMNLCSTIWLIAGRGTAKSFLIALFAVAKCILYPGSQIVIVSSTLGQARLIVKQKIQNELYPKSRRIREAIEKINVSPTDTSVRFKNTSLIQVVVGDDKARGYRATCLIYEECRMMKKHIIDSVFMPFLILRSAPFMKLSEYASYMEPTVNIFITSSWYEDNWIWTQFDLALEDFLNGGNSFAIGIDYAITLRHKIKSKADMQKQRRQQARETWDLECLNLRLKENTDAFFKLSSFKEAQKIRKAFYPMSIDDIAAKKKNPYAIDRSEGEVRLIFADLAFAAGARNDNSIFGCMRLLPHMQRGQSSERNNGSMVFKRLVPYLESVNGGDTLAQAIRLKQLFYDFDADYLVLDTRYAGISVFDLLAKPLYDEDRDVEYEPWTSINNDEYAQRAPVDAKPCIYTVIASAKLNSDIAQALTQTLAGGELELLIPYDEARVNVLPKDKNYMACLSDEAFMYESPYAETQALIKECVDLKYERMDNTGIIRISERGANRKDRYTALSYGNYFATMLERDLENIDESHGYCSFYN